MTKSLKLWALVLATVFGLSINGASAQETGWDFVGTWKMRVTCGDFKMINTVRISNAATSIIEGTTNVDDGFGQIISGTFDGRNVEFVNTFDLDGTKHKEIWKGVLSRKGTYFKGKFSSTLTSTCSFYGSLKK